MNLNLDSWKKFRFGDLIDSIYKAKSYSKEELDLCDSFHNDIIPYVTRTELNNSVEGFAKKDDLDFIEPGNALVVGDTTATISYQKDEFICGDHIVVISVKTPVHISNEEKVLYQKLLQIEAERTSKGSVKERIRGVFK